MEVETSEAGTTGTRTVVDMEVVGGEEVEVGEETGVGEGSIMGSNIGKTETGIGVMEVGISQAPTRDTTPIIRDHIMTVTDLCCNLSGVLQYL